MSNAAAQGPGLAGGRTAGTVALVVGAVLHLVAGFFTFTAIGLISVAPWAIVLLGAAWLAGAVLLLRSVRSRPWLAAAVPVAHAVLLWAVVTIGDTWLGWTA
jgi:hypothetical protein